MKGNPLGIVQVVQIWPYEQMVYAQTEIRLGFWDANGSPNLS